MKQKKGLIVQVSLCLVMLAACLFSYLEKQNELTELRIYIPKLVKEIKLIQEENIAQRYQIQKFESPEHLMQLASDSKYSHLKYPLSKEVLVLQDSPQLDWEADKKAECFSPKIKHTLAVGAK
jgi:preprotein translocase subunit SecD